MQYSLTLKTRTAQKLSELRSNGQLPGVIYGPDREPTPVAALATEFGKLYNTAGESSLIDVMVEGAKEPVKALIQDIQYDPVKGSVIHFDLRQINMSEEMRVAINLIFVGEAPAVKELAGTLMKAEDTLEIKCLPKDLVSEVTVDLGVLKTFDDAIHIKDIKLPAGIVADGNPERLIAKVTPPLSEEELKAMEETPAATIEDIQVEKKGKKEEGEAGEAGAAQATEKK